MTSNNDCYHLWMGDLQKYLRDVHKLQVIVIPFAEYSTNEESKTNYHYFVNRKCFYGFVVKEGRGYFSYEKALEAGLLKGLILIEQS